jgi:hypothetical protein
LLRQDDFAASQLVLFGWNRGKEYGGHQAACLIMSCISNRVRLGWGSLLEVLEQSYKYDAELDPPKLVYPSLWQPDFVRLLHEVGPIKEGSNDPAKGGLYWADSRRITNPWFIEKILGDSHTHKRVGDMNTLNIYI